MAPRSSVSFRLAPALRQRLQAEAAYRGLPLATVCTLALEQYLNRSEADHARDILAARGFTITGGAAAADSRTTAAA